MSELWLPPGARRFPDHVEEVLETASDPAEARRLAEGLHKMGVDFPTEGKFGAAIQSPDSAALLFAEAWGHVTTEDGRRLMAAFVKSPELERAILDATLKLEGAGILNEAEHPLINGLCPALHMRLEAYQIVVPLEFEKSACPMDWRTEALPGFALAIYQEDGSDHAKTPYVATGPLSPANGLILPPRQGGKVGRNDKCPCGSGIKFKRCCGS